MLKRDIDGIAEEKAAAPLDEKRGAAKILADALDEDDVDHIFGTIKGLLKARRTKH
ncbi:MAG: hypothetical protein LUG24_05015 [Clostridiales bacterium]|nr:hypothetical protein [Clostridiales bacterium]